MKWKQLFLIMMLCTIPIVFAAQEDDIKMIKENNKEMLEKIKRIEYKVYEPTLSFFGTEYFYNENGRLFLQLIENSLPNDINDCFVNLYFPNLTGFIKNSFMDKSGFDGLHFKDFIVPNISGIYMATAYCFLNQEFLENNATLFHAINGTVLGNVSDTFINDSINLSIQEINITQNKSEIAVDFNFTIASLSAQQLINSFGIIFSGSAFMDNVDLMQIYMQNKTNNNFNLIEKNISNKEAFHFHISEGNLSNFINNHTITLRFSDLNKTRNIIEGLNFSKVSENISYDDNTSEVLNTIIISGDSLLNNFTFTQNISQLINVEVCTFSAKDVSGLLLNLSINGTILNNIPLQVNSIPTRFTCENISSQYFPLLKQDSLIGIVCQNGCTSADRVTMGSDTSKNANKSYKFINATNQFIFLNQTLMIRINATYNISNTTQIFENLDFFQIDLLNLHIHYNGTPTELVSQEVHVRSPIVQLNEGQAASIIPALLIGTPIEVNLFGFLILLWIALFIVSELFKFPILHFFIALFGIFLAFLLIHTSVPLMVLLIGMNILILFRGVFALKNQ